MDEKETKEVKEAFEVVQDQTWWDLAVIWAGAVIAVSGFMMGGQLMEGLGFKNTFWVTLLGYSLVVILLILQAISGSKLKGPTVLVSSQAFGDQGARKIVATILGISCLGWFGLQTNITGQAFSNFLSIYGYNLDVRLSSLIWGIIMLVTALYGIKMINALGKVTLPILTIISVIITYNAIGDSNWAEIVNYVGDGSITFTQALSSVVGSFAVGAVISPDYFQYTKGESNVVKGAVIGVIPPAIIMIMMGAIMCYASGTTDITIAFMKYSTPLLGIIALLLATWTTNVTNAFSGGQAIIQLFNLPKEKEKQAVATAGGIGIFLAVIGILDYFMPIMNLLTAMIPPVAGVTIASYWVVNKGNPDEFEVVEGYNKKGVISWLVGAVVAALPTVLSFFPSLPQISLNPLIGVVISFVLYLLLNTSKFKND